MHYYLGIDVGTGSARAGIFDHNGRMAASASRSIKMWKPAPDHVEQSSDDTRLRHYLRLHDVSR